MKRSKREYLFLALKGVAMGAADVVPGVSGGTIAFISGIYEELLETISSVNLDALKKLKTEGIKGFWQHINGSFLLPLFAGIFISIISLAKLITYLLETHPLLLWGFFFGLIVSSVYLVAKQIKKWNISAIIGIIVGTAIAYYITILPPMTQPDALWYVFLSGAIAICAMILPGISGSFILLLLGSYEFVLGAVKDLKLLVIGVFAAGCLTGLLSFSKLLNWLFKKYHDLTVAILSGFLVGSLNKIWPWKETLEVFVKHQGEPNEKIIPLVQQNVLPASFEGDAQLLLVAVMVIIGLSTIILLERLATKD